MKNKQKNIEEPKKYLTQIKELSDYNQPERVESLSTKKPIEKKMVEVSEEKPKEPIFTKDKIEVKKKVDRPFTVKDIILFVVNLISVIFLFYLIDKLPQQAKELKRIRNDIELRKEKSDINILKLQESSDKYNKLNKVFLNEAGVVEFVNAVEAIRVDNSAVKKVTFTSQVPIEDKTGNFGYPVVVEFAGNWDRISSDLQLVESLPYLFRTIRFTSEIDEETGNILLDYGIILYVKK